MFRAPRKATTKLIQKMEIQVSDLSAVHRLSIKELKRRHRFHLLLPWLRKSIFLHNFRWTLYWVLVYSSLDAVIENEKLIIGSQNASVSTGLWYSSSYSVPNILRIMHIHEQQSLLPPGPQHRKFALRSVFEKDLLRFGELKISREDRNILADDSNVAMGENLLFLCNKHEMVQHVDGST